MQPRLKRYKKFIEDKYFDGLLKNKEYSIEYITPSVKSKITRGEFERILFTGMGCSAIVSDIIKGFFADQKINLHIEVVNDYAIEHLLNVAELKKKKTLVIVSSYSGYSEEPIQAYHRIKQYTDDILFLTSGGKLGELARRDSISLVCWCLGEPDREYPLFHAPQYFVILLDIFFKLGLIPTNYQQQITQAVKRSRAFYTSVFMQRASTVAQLLYKHDIILLASAAWYGTLLKLVKMHLNEMAMAPAHRNYIHEFGHSEVGVLSSPKEPQAVWIFTDAKEDEYTKQKIRRLARVIKQPVPQNKHITIVETKLNQPEFFTQFFTTLQFVQQVTYFLAVRYNYPSRELISTIAGNAWYSAATIAKERRRK